MNFSEREVENLRLLVQKHMSEHRFKHTLGVEKMAAMLGARIMPEYVSELRCAALLHDIAKEISKDEMLAVMKEGGFTPTAEDMDTPSVYHSFAAPFVIKRDFPKFATPNILSSTFNHTAGAPDMSLFDQIIFISDFAEEGRQYPACISISKKLNLRLEKAKDRNQCIAALELSVFDTLESTIKTLLRIKSKINTRTVLTRNAFLAKILHK